MANETVLFKRGDSATITSTPVTDGQILFDTSGNGKMYLDNGTDRLEMGGAITVDASLSKTSTNAIQNKAVTGNILNSLAEVSAATQQNTIAGALALKEVNSSLTKIDTYVDSEGKLHFVDATGVDTALNFSSAKYIYGIIDDIGSRTWQKVETPSRPKVVVTYIQGWFLYDENLSTEQYQVNTTTMVNFTEYASGQINTIKIEDDGFSAYRNYPSGGVPVFYFILY